MNKNTIKRIIVISILVLIVILSIIFSKNILSFFQNPDDAREWIDSFGILSPIVYCLITASQILIPVIPGEPMELVAGYAFGTIKGTILCILAESIGSIIVIILVKKYGRRILELFFEVDKINSLKILKESKAKEMIFSILFIVPGTPKDLLCYFAGLTSIDTRLLIFLVTIGRLPSVITSTLLGDSINEGNFMFALYVFLITIFVSFIGIILYNKYTNKKQN